MYWMLLLIFVSGYFFIAIEHSIKIDKAAISILTGMLCWTFLSLNQDIIATDHANTALDTVLLEHVGEISEILFFLLGAMTIVELIDAHQGFRIITDKITTVSRLKLMMIICTITFFFSAVLDNLTTTIVMATLLKKLIGNKEDLWFFGGMVVIAANAGGAWSPIGDVTTIMLWIGGQITALNIVMKVFLPSLVCLAVPLGVLSFQLKGDITKPKKISVDNLHHPPVTPLEQKIIFWLGVGGLVSVPIFKNITHLPPFMGMMLSLGILWVTTELMHKKKDKNFKNNLSIAGVIQRIDTPSILFFLGILLAVASLQTAGHLSDMAHLLDSNISSIYIVNSIIGLLSAIVDNVPLVAGAMGMYSMDVYAADHTFWELLAYCAGTGGSVLIIGSAAGVAMMGLMKIDFIWYVKRISGLALLGYFSGILVMYLMG